jgi:hypothetical protein
LYMDIKPVLLFCKLLANEALLPSLPPLVRAVLLLLLLLLLDNKPLSLPNSDDDDGRVGGGGGGAKERLAWNVERRDWCGDEDMAAAFKLLRLVVLVAVVATDGGQPTTEVDDRDAGEADADSDASAGKAEV